MKVSSGIADLLLNGQPKSIQLALVLLQQHPVHKAILTELLFAYILLEDDVLKEATYQCLTDHAPTPLVQTLQQYQILACRWHHINSTFQHRRCYHLQQEGQLKDTPQFVNWIYQHTNKGLGYLLEALDQASLIQLLIPFGEATNRHLDLSNQDLRQFPKVTLEIFASVYRLDLRHNACLAPILPQSLAAFPDLTHLYLEGSIWTTNPINQ